MYQAVATLAHYCVIDTNQARLVEVIRRKGTLHASERTLVHQSYSLKYSVANYTRVGARFGSE